MQSSYVRTYSYIIACVSELIETLIASYKASCHAVNLYNKMFKSSCMHIILPPIYPHAGWYPEGGWEAATCKCDVSQ